MTIAINDSYKGLQYRVDLIDAHYFWQIREGIQKALSLAGHSEDMINEVFNIMGEASTDMCDAKVKGFINVDTHMVGMHLEEALEVLRESDYEYRFLRMDDVDMIITHNFRTSRLNLEVDNEI